MVTAKKVPKVAKAPKAAKSSSGRSDPFVHKLVLNAWMIDQFGVDPLVVHKAGDGRAIPAIRKFSYSILDEEKEGLHEDGRHRFFHELNANWPISAKVTSSQLASY
jgi:hypothetical protein